MYTHNLYVYIIFIHKYTHTLLYNILITIIIEINNACMVCITCELLALLVLESYLIHD